MECLELILDEAHRLLVSTSYGGNTLPSPAVAAASDYILLHGNGVTIPDRIAEMVRQTRQLSTFTPKPIIFNEDDHYDFDKTWNSFVAATSEHASWGFFDFRRQGEGIDEGYQSMPANWGISSACKRGFFTLVREMTGGRQAGQSAGWTHGISPASVDARCAADGERVMEIPGLLTLTQHNEINISYK